MHTLIDFEWFLNVLRIKQTTTNDVWGSPIRLTESIKQHFVVICVLAPASPPDAMLGRAVLNLKLRFSQKTQILERHRFHESVDGIN